MLKKIVVFDGNFGGELFADYIEDELAVVDVIRVIDWRNASTLFENTHLARKTMEESLSPYINKVDIIVIANYYLSQIGLDYLRLKYKNQKFIGFNISSIYKTASKNKAVIFITENLRSMPSYHILKYKVHAKVQEFDCGQWIHLIDDGELKKEQLKEELKLVKNFSPTKVLLANTTLVDIKDDLRRIFGMNIKFEDGFKETYKKLCEELGFRGNDGRKE